MAQKKKTASKKNKVNSNAAVKKEANVVEEKKTTTKKQNTKANSAAKKTTTKKVEAKTASKKVEVKKDLEKEQSITKNVDTYEAKLKEKKEECKFKTWLNNISLEQLIIGGVIVIAILLIVLITVATKNTKTKDGDDIVVQIKGKTITANELYKELKEQNGKNVAINLIDDYILEKEYKTTEDMKKSADASIENYKKTYGDSFEAFLEYNGLKSSNELKELLIKNSKLTSVTDDYLKETISEKEMKKYYEENIVGDINAKHILVSFDYKDDDSDEAKEKKEKEALKKAEDIIKQIKDGKDFSELAKKYSDDKGSKENGGELGYFNKGEMVAEFEEAAYALEVNAYTTKPVKTTYGYHIIMKTGEKKKPSFEKSKDTVIEKIIEEKKTEDETISAKAMIELRKKYNIKIKDKKIKNDYNTYIKDALTTTKQEKNKLKGF